MVAMKRACTLVATLAIVLALLVPSAQAPVDAAAKATPDPCAKLPSKYQQQSCRQSMVSAPGDEYFGRMKMSYLGINNTFHDDAIRAGAFTTDPGIISSVGWADEALNAWMRKYPNDPQLARTYYLASQMFKRIYTREAQEHAWKYMQLLVNQFPNTYFGKLEKKDIELGFTEHYYANPLPCPTPLPPGVNPEELPTPSATATPSPAPGQPKVEIIIPPCIPPATPSPSPSPTPLTTPTPLGTATPQTIPAPPTTAAPSTTPAPLSTPTPLGTPTPS
jgi:hypothetical protein